MDRVRFWMQANCTAEESTGFTPIAGVCCKDGPGNTETAGSESTPGQERRLTMCSIGSATGTRTYHFRSELQIQLTIRNNRFNVSPVEQNLGYTFHVQKFSTRFSVQAGSHFESPSSTCQLSSKDIHEECLPRCAVKVIVQRAPPLS